MNTPNLDRSRVETGALRGDLRPSETARRDRSITARKRGSHSPFGGRAMTVKPPAPPPLPDELDRSCAGCDSHTSAKQRRR